MAPPTTHLEVLSHVTSGQSLRRQRPGRSGLAARLGTFPHRRECFVGPAIIAQGVLAFKYEEERVKRGCLKSAERDLFASPTSRQKAVRAK